MKKTRSLITPKKKQEAYLPASSTVEAALVIPLFLYAALAVIYILQLTAVKQHVQSALYEDARKVAGYAYLYDKSVSGETVKQEDAVSIATVWAFLVEELGSTYAQNHHIVGGNAGLIMSKSKICSNNAVVDLVVTYTIKNPFDIFGIGTVTLTQRAKTDAWLGEEQDAYRHAYDHNQKELYVYVTQEGEVYHINRSCTYLTRMIERKSRSELPALTNAEGGHYYLCERCAMLHGNSSQIYVTQYGNRYHTDITCTQLARTIIRIPISQAGTRTRCRKCGGDKGEEGGIS